MRRGLTSKDLEDIDNKLTKATLEQLAFIALKTAKEQENRIAKGLYI